jgi:hypothetical protein
MAAALACTPLGPALTRAALAADEGAVTVSARQPARTAAPAHPDLRTARRARTAMTTPVAGPPGNSRKPPSSGSPWQTPPRAQMAG